MNEIVWDKRFVIRVVALGSICFMALAFLHEFFHVLTYNLLHPDMVAMGYSAWIEFDVLGLITFHPQTTYICKLLMAASGGNFAFLLLVVERDMKRPEYFSPAFGMVMYTLLEVAWFMMSLLELVAAVVTVGVVLLALLYRRGDLQMITWRRKE